MRILGLDLSITSSGYCIMDVDENNDFKIVGIKLYGFTDTKKWIYDSDDLVITKIPEDYNNHPPHYRSQLIYDIMEDYVDRIDYVAIEDYAYAGKGKIFDLAEFEGGLKNLYYAKKIPIKKFPPMTVKLCVTGHGMADKVMMLMYFKKSELASKVNLHLFDLPDAVSPQEDLIDSICMANVLRCELSYLANEKFPEDAGMKIDNMMASIVLGRKGAKTRPSIEHPLIKFGEFSRVQKKKVSKKVNKDIIVTEKKTRAPKKKMIVPKE